MVSAQAWATVWSSTVMGKAPRIAMNRAVSADVMRRAAHVDSRARGGSRRPALEGLASVVPQVGVRSVRPPADRNPSAFGQGDELEPGPAQGRVVISCCRSLAISINTQERPGIGPCARA